MKMLMNNIHVQILFSYIHKFRMFYKSLFDMYIKYINLYYRYILTSMFKSNILKLKVIENFR